MKIEEIKIKNNQQVKYLSFSIILSGLFLIFWALTFLYPGLVFLKDFFLWSWVLFFIFSLLLIFKIKRIRRMISKIEK